MKYRVSTLALSVVTFGALAILSSSSARSESDYFFAKDPSVGKDEKKEKILATKKINQLERRQKTQKLVGQLQRKIKTLKTRIVISVLTLMGLAQEGQLSMQRVITKMIMRAFILKHAVTDWSQSQIFRPM